MDYKRFEVKPNDNSTSRFKYKIVETTVYNSGHNSYIDVDFFEDIHSATLACEELTQKERD